MLCVVVCCLFTFVFLYVSQLLQCEVAAVGLVEHLLEELFCGIIVFHLHEEISFTAFEEADECFFGLLFFSIVILVIAISIHHGGDDFR